MKLFLDTNVLLDGYFQRIGAASSNAVISGCNGVTDSGRIARHSLSNGFYLVRGHSKSSAIATRFITDLLSWADVVETSKSDAQSGLKDFEDALQLSAAMAVGADALITQNTADFISSTIPVLTPEQFLSAYP
jgi:predicted nucleic acid-binding protein